MSANCFSLWEISSAPPTSYQGFDRPWAHALGTSVFQTPWAAVPKIKISGAATPCIVYFSQTTLLHTRFSILSGTTFSAIWNLLSLTLWRSIERRQIGHFLNFHGLPGCSFRISYADPGPDLGDGRRGHDPGLPPRLPPRMGPITTNIDIDNTERPILYHCSLSMQHEWRNFTFTAEQSYKCCQCRPTKLKTRSNIFKFR